MEFVINIAARYSLIGSILLGAYAIHSLIPKDRIISLFIRVLITFALAFFLGSLNLIFSNTDNIRSITADMLDYKKMLLGVSAQFYLQYFIYNLILSRKNAIKWTIYQISPIALIILITWIGDKYGLFARFSSIDNLPFSELIHNPLFILRTLIIILQCLTGVVMAITARRLIPLCQNYIECTESNSARNIVWITKLCNLFCGLTFTYTIDAFFSSGYTIMLYLIVAFIFFNRTIILMLNHYTPSFNINGDLYNTIGIRWSLTRMWYLPAKAETKDNTSIQDTLLFNEVEEWIDQSMAYTNHNFSFKYISDKFPQFNYNSYNELLGTVYGCNFQAHIRSKRVDLAIRLMQNTDNPKQLKTIAFEVGFESSSSFARAFKAVKGMSASEWSAKVKS